MAAVGDMMPDVALPSTNGGIIYPGGIPGKAVYVIYPYTGRPGVPDPEGWDSIPGAHGSTPQLLAYSACYDKYISFDIKIFGISLQTTEWQLEFVERVGLRFLLLSDAARSLDSALGLQTFAAGRRLFLRRRTLVVDTGKIILDRSEINQPETDSDIVLAWIENTLT